jgi:hypothetical protein
MTISTPDYRIAQEIVEAIRLSGGKTYSVYSSGIVENVPNEHRDLIFKAFKGRGVYVDHKPVE